MASVSVRGLRKRFGATEVLRGVSVDVPRGAFAVLVGPSGCGKSTLLRLLAGLEQADEGTILFDERDVTRLEPRERDIAMVFQSYALYPHLTVRDNLAFGLRLRKMPDAEIARRIEDASGMLGLAPLLDRLPKALSGGQRQRVAMGRAIVRQPALFLFDEPLSNLDAALRAQVRVDIRKLHDRLGATSVYVTHDQVEAMTLADVLFILNKGMVEQAGPPLLVYARPATRFVAGFLGSPAMNFLPGRLSRIAAAEASPAPGSGPTGAAWRVALAGGLAARFDPGPFEGALREDRAVSFGVRPHDVEPVEAGTEGTLAMEVSLVEALGAESFAYGTLAGAPFVARLEGSAPLRKGDTLHFRPRAVHLFDATTGATLADLRKEQQP